MASAARMWAFDHQSQCLAGHTLPFQLIQFCVQTKSPVPHQPLLSGVLGFLDLIAKRKLQVRSPFHVFVVFQVDCDHSRLWAKCGGKILREKDSTFAFFHLVWPSLGPSFFFFPLGPSMLLQMALFHFLWLHNIPTYIYIYIYIVYTTSLTIHLLMYWGSQVAQW